MHLHLTLVHMCACMLYSVYRNLVIFHTLFNFVRCCPYENEMYEYYSTTKFSRVSYTIWGVYEIKTARNNNVKNIFNAKYNQITVPDITFTVAGAGLSLKVEVKSHHKMVVCRVMSGGCPYVASGLKAASYLCHALCLIFFSSPQVPSPSPIAVVHVCRISLLLEPETSGTNRRLCPSLAPLCPS